MAESKLQDHFSTKVVDTPMQQYVSRMLVREWKVLGRLLLVSKGKDHDVDVTLDRIETDNKLSVQECCYKMLLEWHNRKADEATAAALIQALEDMGQKLLAENLKTTILHECQTEQAEQSRTEQSAAVHAAEGKSTHLIPVQQDSRCPPHIKKQPTQLKHKKFVYQNIGESWDELGEELGLSKQSLKTIEAGVDSLSIRCKKMLNLWEEGETTCTVGELEEALLRIYEGKLAEELVKL